MTNQQTMLICLMENFPTIHNILSWLIMIGVTIFQIWRETHRSSSNLRQPTKSQRVPISTLTHTDIGSRRKQAYFNIIRDTIELEEQFVSWWSYLSLYQRKGNQTKHPPTAGRSMATYSNYIIVARGFQSILSKVKTIPAITCIPKGDTADAHAINIFGNQPN